MRLVIEEGEMGKASMKLGGDSLSDMVLEFFEERERHEWADGGSSSDGDEVAGGSAAETKVFWESQHQLLEEALSRSSSTEGRIRREGEEVIRNVREEGGAVCSCCASKECGRNCVLRDISDRLRGRGYNSALCKSKWRRSPDIPSGEHSYIDVLVEPKGGKKGLIRVVIEPNFRAEFEMARASPEYNALVSRLPEVFVGKSEKLRSVIRIMCAAAKKCMKDNKMHMGPWRKHKYMQAKWLGTCERITPSLMLPAAAVSDRPPKPRASMLTFDLHCTVVEVV